MKQLFVIAVALMAVVGGLVAQAPRSAELQFKAAQHKEEVEGDLKGAIEEYKKIAQTSDRVLAARALLRLAGCYQKLGDAEVSQKAYERVVREFADETTAAAEARTRLASLRRAPSSHAGIVTRQVWTGPKVDILGSVSPDGRYLSFPNWETGDLALHDFVTGWFRLQSP